MTATIRHPSGLDKLEDLLHGCIRQGRIPGIQYVAVNSEGYLFDHADGAADITNRRPMEVSTTMMAYSMTKTFTAAATLQLVEHGRLGLDDSIQSYIPDINPYGNAVTIRHLLSQTSGIPNPVPLRWVHPAERRREFDEDAALSDVLRDNHKLAFQPGSRFLYSNISYWLLGKIIERASGRKYQDYMAEHVFAPLGMTKNELSFAIQNPDAHSKGYLARYSMMGLLKGFLVDKELIGTREGKWVNIKDHNPNGAAFGGLVGSAHCIGRFLQDQLGTESRLFDSTTMSLFRAQQRNRAGELIPMTLGWHIGSFAGVPCLFKEGGGGGYHCEMRLYPKAGIATVIMANETSALCTRLQTVLDAQLLLQGISPCSYP